MTQIRPFVGVSLLAIAFCQPQIYWLIHRYREQAHSYRVCALFRFIVRQKPRESALPRR